MIKNKATLWGMLVLAVAIGALTASALQAQKAKAPTRLADPQAGTLRYRYWLTGHIHTQKQFEFPGCLVESFRVLAPQDAWASNKGYRSGRDMKAIVYHIDFGEVSRVTVNPEMFRE